MEDEKGLEPSPLAPLPGATEQRRRERGFWLAGSSFLQDERQVELDGAAIYNLAGGDGAGCKGFHRVVRLM
jgi:hypothetical protein